MHSSDFQICTWRERYGHNHDPARPFLTKSDQPNIAGNEEINAARSKEKHVASDMCGLVNCISPTLAAICRSSLACFLFPFPRVNFTLRKTSAKLGSTVGRMALTIGGNMYPILFWVVRTMLFHRDAQNRQISICLQEEEDRSSNSQVASNTVP